jgi:hypothetical protein
MRLKLFTVVLLAISFLPATALANEPACCEADTEQCAMACCKHDEEADGVELLLSIGSGLMTADEWLPPPVRQRGVVWFHRPVWVGRNVLMGKYIIEHDTDRQARGEPCTHIYAAGAPDTPIVAFHCTHLEAERQDRTVVGVQFLGGAVQKLLWFQFAGEEAAHGYPAR